MVRSRKTLTDTSIQLTIIKGRTLFFLLILPLLAMIEKDTSLAFSHIDSSVHNDSAVCDSLIKFASKYLKKPYCYGSNPPKCFDCSGFVNFVFGNFGKVVPNSSGAIALQGKFISFKNAVAGDLIFFTGRNSQSETVGHVGIVTEEKNGTINFIHASVQAGVIVSNTEEDYYKKRLLFVKRVKL